MLWMLLFLVLLGISFMVRHFTKSKREWERELLYLTRHENPQEDDNLDALDQHVETDHQENFPPVFVSARQVKSAVSARQTYDHDKEDFGDLDDGISLSDLPIFAQHDIEQQVEPKAEGYFFPEDAIEIPFEEQFKPFEEIEPADPVVITLNTRTTYASPNKAPSISEPEIISLQDVRKDLSRYRKLSNNAPTLNHEPSSLPIIDTDEVLQNLAHTDSPIHRKRGKISGLSVIPQESLTRQNRRTLTSRTQNKSKARDMLFSRFTPYEKIVTEFVPEHTNIFTENDLGNSAFPMPSQPVVDSDEFIFSEVDNELDTEILSDFLQEENLPAHQSSVERFFQQIELSKIDNEVAFLPTTISSAEPVINWPSQQVTEPVFSSVEAGTSISTNSAPVSKNAYSRLLPSVRLLFQQEAQSQSLLTDEILLERGILIEEKLAEFKVKVNVIDAYAGPVITRYEIEPAVGIRGAQVLNLEKDLARALGLVSIRVVETIPGKTCMGLELPNPQRQMIRLSAILSSRVFIESHSKLTLALGQDITGEPIVADLAKAPHLLVAGTTGSGKSVGVNAMILSLLFKATPEEVRLIMIDPKMLELSVYEGIPHLLAPVVTDMKLASNALTWCVNEMEKRYRLMSYMGVRNITGFNQKIDEGLIRRQRLTNPYSLTPENPEPLEKLPFIVVVVDEFADLMMVSGKKIEELIARLAQKARAAGIHLILATQRPSVDVITGLIKANIPTRIAFQVSSKIDSRTILDQMGAENLLGQGDMLFLPPGTGYPNRVHGAFVADEEVHRVVTYLKDQFGEPNYIDDILNSGVEEGDLFSNASNGKGAEDDPLYDEAVALVVKSRRPSISSVQRQLRIGYNRAARLIEQMEASGIVSPMESNGNRTVLIPDRSSE